MINISRAFRQNLFYNKRDYLAFADITLSSGTVLNLTNTQIWSGGFSTEDAVSDDNTFSALGSTIIGAATLVINNMDESFSGYDFINAAVVLYIGMEITENGTTRTEKLRKGTYTVDDTSYNGGTITLTLLDNMEQFDRPYKTSTLTYPATLDAIVRNACTSCGVSLGTVDFPHKNFVIAKKPEDEAITYREVVGWAACIAGCFARCNRYGNLELTWFDQTTLEGRANVLDGGRSFNSAGTLVDGGGFNTNYDTVDGGGLATDFGMHYIQSLYSQDVSMDDVVITGIRITVKDESDEGNSSTMDFASGTSGYEVTVEGNDFITPDNGQEITTWLGQQLIGLTFRKASVTHASDPSIEAGDIGLLWDRKGNEHPILITRTNFSATSPQTTVCGAETPSRNNATRYGWQTKSYVESRKLLKKEVSARELMMQDLSERLAAHSGLYSTVEATASGSIYYLHDMPDLIDSAIVWKMTTEAWGVTTNYNRGVNTVWNAGMTVDGNTIVRILSAVGVNADWITTGSIQDAANKNYWNMTTGEFRLAATATVGGSAIASTSDIGNPVVSTDVEYGNSDSGSTAPSTWTTNASWVQGKYLWARTKMTMKDGTTTYSAARRIANGDGIGVAEVIEQYYLSTSSSEQTGGEWKNTQPTWVSGRYYWTRSRITWADGTKTATTPVLARGLTSGNQSTDNLDSSLNQLEIFNRLTNNGQTQGIYLTNNKLYINATYIATGTLADANNNTSFNLSTGALTMKKGSINIGDGNFVVNSSGNMTAKNATLTGADVSGKITSSANNQKLTIHEALVRGYYGSTKIGTLDLSAEYADNTHKVVLSADRNELILHGATQVSLTVGSGQSTSNAYLDANGLHCNALTVNGVTINANGHSGGASFGPVYFPAEVTAGQVTSYWTAYVVDGIIKLTAS